MGGGCEVAGIDPDCHLRQPAPGRVHREPPPLGVRTSNLKDGVSPMKPTSLRPWVLTAVAVIGLNAFVLGSNPVLDWNLIAVNAALAGNQTISPGSTSPGGTGLYLAYVHLAVFNAVNAIDHRYHSYRAPGLTAPRGASRKAAAISAAYQTLLYYFPDQSASLADQYSLSLAAIPDGPAKDKGVWVGQAAAAQLIALRSNDGRGAKVTYTYPSTPEPGVWIPTPPGFLAPAIPWAGQMVPFTMSSASQFLPQDGPDDLGSRRWVHDYNETRILGAHDSTVRTPQQTEIGLFWTAHTSSQYAAVLRQLAAERGLSTSQSAHFFATVWTAFADSLIGCFNAKYHFGFWRPVTAIPNGDIDGNPETPADPAWLPLGTTPNHPEFPAAHACLTGSFARTLELYFHTPHIRLTVNSSVTGTTHTFSDVRDLEDEVFMARIYAGFHYRHSLHEGRKLGHHVAEQVHREYFRPRQGDGQ
jgi:PAP2 superfamily